MDDANIIHACAKSDIGLKREENEDSHLIVDHRTNDVDIKYYGRMYAVADGLGGHAGGKIASGLACQGLLDYYNGNKYVDKETKSFYRTRLLRLNTIIYGIHDRIRKYGEENSEYKELGTTLSVLVLIKNRALIAHVGDSRIYRLRKNSLEQITKDHTMAQILIDLNYLSPQTSQTHPSHHILTQAVGHEMEFIYNSVEKVRKGDTFLLCSDGLYNRVSDREIKDVLLSNSVPSKKCRQLVIKALETGGTDNITLIIVQI